MTTIGSTDKQEAGRWANKRVENRHLTDRQTYKTARSAALAEWQNLMPWVGSGLGMTPQIGDGLRLD